MHGDHAGNEDFAAATNVNMTDFAACSKTSYHTVTSGFGKNLPSLTSTSRKRVRQPEEIALCRQGHGKHPVNIFAAELPFSC
ncbi:hypothetical protein [Jiella mangrovi]|uniref:Uncharacterized protein n=1 Tax=Jiella mangrovi TaxID=2821407 RepID=A0ABS4BFR5_9HYPH|nr:hypothetical protein [Jiella mangrovi]MBP0615596.1 hypothetical protein [Jiella mangrovi]